MRVAAPDAGRNFMGCKYFLAWSNDKANASFSFLENLHMPSETVELNLARKRIADS
jgi:hypothetical protein